MSNGFVTEKKLPVFQKETKTFGIHGLSHNIIKAITEKVPLVYVIETLKGIIRYVELSNDNSIHVLCSQLYFSPTVWTFIRESLAAHDTRFYFVGNQTQLAQDAAASFEPDWKVFTESNDEEYLEYQHPCSSRFENQIETYMFSYSSKSCFSLLQHLCSQKVKGEIKVAPSKAVFFFVARAFELFNKSGRFPVASLYTGNIRHNLLGCLQYIASKTTIHRNTYLLGLAIFEEILVNAELPKFSKIYKPVILLALVSLSISQKVFGNGREFENNWKELAGVTHQDFDFVVKIWKYYHNQNTANDGLSYWMDWVKAYKRWDTTSTENKRNLTIDHLCDKNIYPVDSACLPCFEEHVLLFPDHRTQYDNFLDYMDIVQKICDVILDEGSDTLKHMSESQPCSSLL